MNVVLLAARLVLAAIFAWSALAKLVDRPGSRRAMLDFGVPTRLATPLAVLVPTTEFVVAGSLVPATSAWWGALAALTLLLTFTTVVAYHLARGRAPRCHCFGQTSAEPVGPATLVRNAILAAIAGVVLLAGSDDAGASVTGWLTTTSAAQRAQLGLTALAIALLAYGCAILRRLRQELGTLSRHLGDREAGTVAGAEPHTPAPTSMVTGGPAPAFALPDLAGDVVTLDDLLGAGRPVLLVFSDPACGSCRALMPEIDQWQSDYADRLTIAVLSAGPPEANRSHTGQHQVPVLLQGERDVAADYQVPGTPCAIVVLHDGTGATPACGADEIRRLAAHAATLDRPDHRPATDPPGPSVGEPAPAFTLPDLDGHPVSLADFQGRHTLLLFWNPGCGFCTDMLADLRELDTAAHEHDGPSLVVISVGEPAENRALGLRCPVLIEESPTVASAFGASGTPMAVLVDPDGRIGSEVAAGAAAVLAVATTRHTSLAG